MKKMFLLSVVVLLMGLVSFSSCENAQATTTKSEVVKPAPEPPKPTTPMVSNVAVTPLVTDITEPGQCDGGTCADCSYSILVETADGTKFSQNVTRMKRDDNMQVLKAFVEQQKENYKAVSEAAPSDFLVVVNPNKTVKSIVLKERTTYKVAGQVGEYSPSIQIWKEGNSYYQD